ncbi:DUF6064 family protein [Ancylobacter sp.]|uniref:DUF6064 family protein n=1 Tax=Ancylobacter sp. TaxID=1872567 RepID=UPI003D0C5C98
MPEWSSYGLEDFLLFSPRAYWRLFEAQNAALWPLQLATMAAGLALLLLILRRPGRAKPWVGLLLGLLWAFVAWSFLLQRYEAINWAVAYAAPAFFVQALLLVGAAVLPGGPAFGRRDPPGWAGLGIALAGLLYPLLAPAAGRPLASAEVFGLAPDPTVLVTIGMVLMAGGRWRALLLPIPLLWGLFSGLTLLAMGDVQAWLLLVSVAIAVLSAVTGRRVASDR